MTCHTLNLCNLQTGPWVAHTPSPRLIPLKTETAVTNLQGENPTPYADRSNLLEL